MNKHNKAETDFFIVALKEEARTAIWQVGSSIDPDTLIESVIEEIQALAPRPDGQEDRSDEEIRRQVGECLVKAAYATRPHCIRCGTCCTKGSPTLTVGDLDLFTRDIVKPYEVLTIRKGELARAAGSDEFERTEKELVKIREVPVVGQFEKMNNGTKKYRGSFLYFAFVFCILSFASPCGPSGLVLISMIMSEPLASYRLEAGSLTTSKPRFINSSDTAFPASLPVPSAGLDIITPVSRGAVGPSNICPLSAMVMEDAGGDTFHSASDKVQAISCAKISDSLSPTLYHNEAIWPGKRFNREAISNCLTLGILRQAIFSSISAARRLASAAFWFASAVCRSAIAILSSDSRTLCSDLAIRSLAARIFLLDSRWLISEALFAACPETRAEVAVITPAIAAISIVQNESACQNDRDHTDFSSESFWVLVFVIASMWVLLIVFLYLQITARRKRRQLKYQYRARL